MSSQDYRRSQANARALATIFRRQEEAERGSPLRSGGVGAGGIVVKGGSIRVLDGGNLEVDGEATFGGNTTIGGNARITGTLSLPAGIIDNDALASPSNFGTTGGGAGGFTVGTTAKTVAAQQIVVPPGYSRAIVMALATAAAQNTTAGADFLYVGAKLGNVEPNLTWALAGPSGYANASASATRTITGLNGGVIQCAVMVSTGVGTWSGPSMANLDAIAIFLR